MKKILLGFLIFSQIGASGLVFADFGSDRSAAAAANPGTASASPASPTAAAAAAGSTVFTGTGLDGGADIVDSELTGSVSKETDIKTLIIAWTNFILPIAATVAVLAVVWAGFLYVTAFGDDGRMDSAKKIIIWVVVGLLVIAAAYAIVNFIMSATF